MDELDLRHGEPEVMRGYWARHRFDVTMRTGYDEHIRYPKDGPLSRLKHAIVSVHEAVGNAKARDKHVVVGVGATQLLGALMAVYQNFRYANVPWHITSIAVPYWFRMPTIAQARSVRFITSSLEPWSVIASPSNPTGSLRFGTVMSSDAIMDLAYHWPQYYNQGEEVPMTDHEVSVFSLSKATGHAGHRIGWALIRSECVALEVAKYVENDTCGVSTSAQDHAAEILEHQVAVMQTDPAHGIQSVFDDTRGKLIERRRVLGGLFEKLGMNRVDERGMYVVAHAPGQDAAERVHRDLGLTGTSGEVFGMTKDVVRLNIGCDDDKFAELVRRLISAAP